MPPARSQNLIVQNLHSRTLTPAISAPHTPRSSVFLADSLGGQYPPLFQPAFERFDPTIARSAIVSSDSGSSGSPYGRSSPVQGDSELESFDVRKCSRQPPFRHQSSLAQRLS